jgi:3-dehydro-L-gulonate 2-dehydrogenase
MLDMLAALLSDGKATNEIVPDPLAETALSQVFVATDLYRLLDRADADRIADDVVEHVQTAVPAEAGQGVRYPGEGTLRTREENLRLGIPVDAQIWEQVQAM